MRVSMGEHLEWLRSEVPDLPKPRVVHRYGEGEYCFVWGLEPEIRYVRLRIVGDFAGVYLGRGEAQLIASESGRREHECISVWLATELERVYREAQKTYAAGQR